MLCTLQVAPKGPADNVYVEVQQSKAALNVVMLTAYDATSDDKVGITTTVGFQLMPYRYYATKYCISHQNIVLTFDDASRTFYILSNIHKLLLPYMMLIRNQGLAPNKYQAII